MPVGLADPSSALVVQVPLDALVVDAPASVAGQDLDFAALPWTDAAGDHNASTPNLSAYASARPFRTNSLRLSPGVHLHWALPHALTRGATQPRAWSAHHVDGLHFPASPNRWVIRRLSGGRARHWLVVSDYVWDEDHADDRRLQTDETAISHPKPAAAPGVQPFIRLGRQFDLDEAAVAAPWRTLPDYDEVLSCIGYGEPAFAALYGNCHSVFGGRDPDIPNSIVRYDVVGWHETPVGRALPLDPVATFARTLDVARDAARLRGRLNREAPETARSLDTPLDDAEAREAARLLFRDAFGWDLPSGSGLPARMFCRGQVEVDRSKSVEVFRENMANIVAVGNDSGEAVSTLVAATAADGDGARRIVFERRNEAVRLAGRLQGETLDLGARLDTLRHDGQFATVAEHRLWRIAPPETPAQGGPVAPPGESVGVTLPPALVRALNDLNAAQHRHKMEKARIESLRMRLYADWHAWLELRRGRTARSDAVDANALAAMIRRDCAALRASLDALGAPDGPTDGLAGALQDGRRALEDALEMAAASDPSLGGLRLVHAPGPRFFRPADPVLAIAHGFLQHGARHATDPTAFALLRDEAATAPAGASDLQALRGLVDAICGQTAAPGTLPPELRQGPSTWNPFRVEWQVETAPSTAAAGQALPESLVTASHAFGPGPAALQPTGGHAVPGAVTTVTGRTLVRPVDESTLTRVVEATVGDIGQAQASRDWRRSATWLTKPGGRPVTIALDGLNDALAGMVHRHVLPVDDPVASPEDRDLTREVAELLGGFKSPAPDVDGGFEPIRTGWLRVVRLRVVDSFGRVATLTPRHTVPAESLGGDPANDWAPAGWFAPPPRIVQPARLAADWLSAADDAAAMGDQATTTPVRGWLSVSHLDRGQIAFHDADGRALGLVDVDGRWRPAPGEADAPASPGGIADPTLAAIGRALGQRGDGGVFVRAFAEGVDAVLGRINPPDLDDHEARSLLTARPVAVVRCRIALEMLGSPLEGRRMRDIAARLAGRPPHTRGMERVRFPLRLGDAERFGDGLVGYWVEGPPERPGGPPFRNGGAFTFADGRTVLSEAPAPAPTIAAADRPLVLTMLFDPRAALHVSCGALPNVAIRIPPTHYRASMGRIAFTHRVAPLLTPASALELPLPVVAGGAWSWLSRTSEGWTRTSAALHVARSAVLAEWPSGGAALWDRLVEIGWLRDTGRDEFRLVPPSQPASPDPVSMHGGSPDVLKRLSRIAQGVRPPSREPRFDAPMMLREGWMRLDTVEAAEREE